MHSLDLQFDGHFFAVPGSDFPEIRVPVNGRSRA
jgi:hypothetical protein